MSQVASALSPGSRINPRLQPTQGPASGRGVWRLDPEVAGPGYSPTQRREHIHAVFDEIAQAGGGTLYWPGEEYVVDRPPHPNEPAPGANPASYTTWQIWGVVPANTTIIGEPGAALVLDPSTAALPWGLTVLHFGAWGESGSNITIQGLRVVCNESVIGGGSIWAIGSRRPPESADRVDNIRVIDCAVVDCRIAVSASKSATRTDMGEDKYTNWEIFNCDFDTNSNRMVELQQMNGAIIAFNRFRNCETAVHILSHVENLLMVGNYGSVRFNGLMINYGVRDCTFAENRFWYEPGATGDATLRFHSEPNPTSYTVERISFHHNIWGVSENSQPRSLMFQLRDDAVDVRWQDITFHNDVFHGEVILRPFAARQAGRIDRMTFKDCFFHGPVNTVSPEEFAVSDVRFDSCSFRSERGSTIGSFGMFVSASSFQAQLVIESGSTDSVLIGNVWPEDPEDRGSDTRAVSNVSLTVQEAEPDDVRPDVRIDVGSGVVTISASDDGLLRRVAANLYDEHNSQLVAAIGSTSASVPLDLAVSEHTWSIPSGVPPGAYTVRAAATDVSGNTGVATAPVVVD